MEDLRLSVSEDNEYLTFTFYEKGEELDSNKHHIIPFSKRNQNVHGILKALNEIYIRIVERDLLPKLPR